MPVPDSLYNYTGTGLVTATQLLYIMRVFVQSDGTCKVGLINGFKLAFQPSDTGLKKEVREMLPVVVFKESFLIRETQ
jgi:hypothetical protein